MCCLYVFSDVALARTFRWLIRADWSRQQCFFGVDFCDYPNSEQVLIGNIGFIFGAIVEAFVTTDSENQYGFQP